MDEGEQAGGGGGGIRTRETVHHRLHALQACALDRSATPPRWPGSVANAVTGGNRGRQPSLREGCRERVEQGGGAALARAGVVVAVEKGALLGEHELSVGTVDRQLDRRQ
jgi:hypothetical protein